MLRPMEIPVGVSQIERANRAMADLARNTRAVGAASQGIGFGGPGRSPRVPALGSYGRPLGLLGGPNYNLLRAQQRLGALRSLGAPGPFMQDAQGALLR